jgi:amino acid adenylation domain-containing protein
MSGESLAERLSKLSPVKRALLDLKLRQNGGRSSTEKTIPHRAEQNLAPLSFAQQRLWFLNQLEPQDPTYNEGSALQLTGDLDVDALARAINHIVSRHQVLRTNFVTVDGNPMQRIAEHRTVHISSIDLRAHGRENRDAEAERLVSESLHRPFDLSRDLMLRPLLLRMDDRQHLLLVVKHHIASDGWSSSIFWRELSVLYQAFSTGEAPLLPELPIQYADYAMWQREWLQGDNLESQISYWRSQLAGVPILNLPTDRPRPVIQSYCGARRSFALPADLCGQLRSLSRQEGVTLFMTLLAAFQTLLHRYSAQDDIAVGTPIAGRTRPETEPLIGFFVNTLVLRTDLSGQPTFRELLARVRQVALDAYDHQDLPFEKLVQEINPERTLSHAPLFQALFAYQNMPRSSAEFSGLAITPVDLDKHIAKFDLSIRMWDAADAMEGTAEYKTDLYDAATVDRMIEHFQTLLAAIVRDSEQNIDQLPLLTETEKLQLLQQSIPAKTSPPKDKTLAELFEAQVENSSAAVAIICESQQLTYRELNQRANRLAHRLRGLGVGPDVLVGLCVERSIELVIGMLGILKAGGAYVPFDPSYPKDRLAFLLKDSDVSVLLTQKHLAANLPAHEAAVVYLDGESLRSSTGEDPREANLASRAKPDNLAYVIYTSGSTGKPKGALITHYNVVRLFQSTQEWFDFNSSDVWTLFHSSAFDFSVWEIWGALLSGGRLVVISHAVSRSPEEFAALVKQQGVTVLNQTPSAFRQLMPHLISSAPSERSALRYIIFGGEALELQSLQPWFDRYGDETPKLINMYGITETTVHVTYRPITQPISSQKWEALSVDQSPI